MLKNLYIKSLEIDWKKIPKESYLRKIKAVKKINSLEFSKNVTFFVGENQSGKSTLIEAIAVAYGFNPEGGTLNFNFSTYDDVSELCGAMRLSKGFLRPQSHFFFRAESFFTVSSQAEIYDKISMSSDELLEYGRPSYGDRHLHEQSHGESFMSFMEHYDRPGLFIMDEPEAALSPQRQLVLFKHIVKMAESGSQFIIATHSPILIALPGAEIMSFDGGKIHPCEYQNTECFQIVKAFVGNTDVMVKRVLQD